MIDKALIQPRAPGVELLATRDFELNVVETCTKLAEGLAVVPDVLEETDREARLMPKEH